MEILLRKTPANCRPERVAGADNERHLFIRHPEPPSRKELTVPNLA
jgi:hypothetical protein